MKYTYKLLLLIVFFVSSIQAQEDIENKEKTVIAKDSATVKQLDKGKQTGVEKESVTVKQLDKGKQTGVEKESVTVKQLDKGKQTGVEKESVTAKQLDKGKQTGVEKEPVTVKQLDTDKKSEVGKESVTAKQLDTDKKITADEKSVKEEEVVSPEELEKQVYRTNILGSLLVDYENMVCLEKTTFFDDQEITPEYIIETCNRVHDISKKSYTYSLKYEDFCDTFRLKDLEELEEMEVKWTIEEWEVAQINNLNLRLNVRDREIRELLKKLKEKKRKKNINNVGVKPTTSGDKEMLRLIDKYYEGEGFVVLKVSEPIFSEGLNRAMVYMTETHKNIVTKYLKVLKKNRDRWCVKGIWEIEKKPRDKSKIKMKKIRFDQYDDKGSNFVDGKKLSDIEKKEQEEKDANKGEEKEKLEGSNPDKNSNSSKEEELLKGEEGKEGKGKKGFESEKQELEEGDSDKK